MLKQIRRPLGSALALLAAGLIAAGPAQAQDQDQDQADDVYEITLAAVQGQLAFDITDFAVAPGSTVRILLENDDDMPHNVIIASQPGGEEVYMDIATQVIQMGGDALEAEYIPDSDMVLAHSSLLQPGDTETFEFTAPDQLGAYPYVCTVPGHASTMNGVMHVTEDGQPLEHVPDKPSAFSELTYRYYEGQWTQLPDFNQLEPVHTGQAPGNLVSLDPRERDEYFGFVFEGQLPIEQAGTYTFFLASDDGSRLYIDDEMVIDHDGLHGAEMRTGQTHLETGTRQVRVEYFEHTHHQELSLGWAGPDDQPLLPLSTDDRMADIHRFIVHVQNRPVLRRLPLPDTSSRSIAVGLPEGNHFVFDAEALTVRYGWQGGFLDAGPKVGYAVQRGGDPANLLGPRFDLGAVDRPLRIGTPDEPADGRFLGYRLGDHAVDFHYEVAGTRVTQTVQGVPDAPGFQHTFQLDPAPSQAVFFRLDADASLQLDASAGQWASNVLEVPAAEAERFTVTVIQTDF